MVYRNDVAIAMTLGSAAGASQGTYSTEEVRIGTWIDGKPLYRIVKNGKMAVPKADTDIKLFELPAELEQLVALHGIKDRSWGGFSLLPNSSLETPSEGGKTTYAVLWYTKKEHSVYYRTNQDTDQSFTFSWILIAEYTKTTDKAVTSGVSFALPNSVEASGSDAKTL